MLSEVNFVNRLKSISVNFIERKNIYSFGLVIIIFFLDRFSKVKIINQFSERIYFVNDFINFDLVWNIGIGFGLLSTDSNMIYNVVTTIIFVVIFVLIYVLTISKGFEKFCYTFIIGGAFGNFYDRLIYKAVPDFIDVHYNNIHWFIFNVADIFITMGIITLLITNYLKKN
jgi:signal peptidase II